VTAELKPPQRRDGARAPLYNPVFLGLSRLHLSAQPFPAAAANLAGPDRQHAKSPMRMIGWTHLSSAMIRSIAAPPRREREPRVLLIDDDPDVAPLVSAALGPYEVGVDSVTCGADAMSRFQKHPYELLILDLTLGDLHGFEVLHRIKADRKFREPKVLVLTADTTLEVLARSFGHGADDFLTKPFVVEELGMRVFRLLDHSFGS
jgi:CheY-like chemotaxis protein